MRFADLIERYGVALEWDFQTRCGGADLGEYWRDRRRHRKALNLIDHLPSDSAFVAAMLDDPDTAAAVAAGRMKVAGEDTGPSTTEWSPLREGLARIEDRLAIQTIATLAAAGSTRLPKFKPVSRPTTAMGEAVLAAQRLVEHTKFEEIVRLFAPHEFPDDPPPGG